MSKLWQKSGSKLHPLIEKYTVGDDYLIDLKIMSYDIIASKAHAEGLKKIGILTNQELKKILQTLDELSAEHKKGLIKITPADEDCHTVIENYLTTKLGALGKKIHTGRSRNDQVLTAIRLYQKDQLTHIAKSLLELAQVFLNKADKYQDTPLPGYSHTQQAMLSSLGHYFSAFAESLIDDEQFLQSALKHIDKNPLGSAAGFGVSIPLDREFTTEKLGFAAIQTNALYCQNSRGKFESIYLEALSQIMLTLGKFAQDMLIFTSQEFDFFTVGKQLTTGSSIMPQKQNLDGLEILRGNTSVVLSNQSLVKQITKNLLSGYNRDLQLIKKPLIENTELVVDSIEIASLYLSGLLPKPEKITAQITPAIYMADYANHLVLSQGIPFREAYMLAKEASPEADPKSNIKSKVSLGAPGNLALTQLRRRCQQSQNMSTITNYYNDKPK